MGKQTADLHINPSEETIGLGLLVVRFLLTGTTRLAATRPLSSLSRAHSAWPLRRIATTITKRRSLVSTEC